MPNIIPALRTYLIAETAIADGKVYKTVARAGTLAPYMVIKLLDQERTIVHGKRDKTVRATISIAVFGKDNAETESLSNEVHASLEAYRGDLGGLFCPRSHLISESDDGGISKENAADGRVYAHTLDAEIWYHSPIP